VIHEDLAHRSRRDTKEVGTILPLDDLLVHELDVGFVNESRWAQGVAGGLRLHEARGDFPKLAIDARIEAVQNLGAIDVRRTKLMEKVRDAGR
jgi:hypothetical protein